MAATYSCGKLSRTATRITLYVAYHQPVLRGHHALDRSAVLGAVKALRFAPPAQRPFGALTAPPGGGLKRSCVMAVRLLHAW
jgi:hypothetical protein